MTPKKATRPAVTRHLVRSWQVSLAATLMLGASPLALHAEISNGELAREIAELKAQIRSLKGGVAEAKSEARRKTKVVVAPPATYVPPPTFAAIPPGASPVYVTGDKKMQYGALTITPGGFIAMESVTRTRTEQTPSVLSNFGAVPTNNTTNAHTAENHIDARQTRFALLIEAPISKTFLVSGYGEFDFLGAGTTSNNNQTYSYVPRIRNLYTTLDSSDYGLHVLAGQNWSLVTLNSKGITPRNEVPPPQIDAGFIPGFEYARVPQIRVTKDFNKKLWLSVDFEASQAANIGGSSAACSNIISNAAGSAAVTNAIAGNGVGNDNCLSTGSGGSIGGAGLNQQFSFNRVPDLVAKAAYEARFGERDIHLEGFGVVRELYNNVNYGAAGASTFANGGGFPSSSNQNRLAYGFGAGIIAPILPKRLDFQISGLAGRGIGRYMSTAGMPDATVNGNGALTAVGGAAALVGLIGHVTPAIDIYAFSGFEQVNRTFTSNGAGGEVGYGLTGGVNNYGCGSEGGTCAGQTHRVFQITGGFNDKLYKGAFGEVRVGAQYSYTVRQLFAATTNANGIATAAAPLVGARANDSTILTSLRYYPFQ